MTIEEFMSKEKKRIDKHIIDQLGKGIELDDHERELWIMNDEVLYFWAKDQGVDLDLD